jgi:hypothetical protein
MFGFFRFMRMLSIVSCVRLLSFRKFRRKGLSGTLGGVPERTLLRRKDGGEAIEARAGEKRRIEGFRKKELGKNESKTRGADKLQS